MKRIRTHLFVVSVGLLLAGCSSQTPQATDEIAKQFSGGPMPPDAQKKFQESMKKNGQQAGQNGQASGKQ